MTHASSQPIRAVLFDLDGTLYRQLPIRLLMGLELLSLVARLRSVTAARRIWRAVGTFRRVREELRDTARVDGSLDALQYAETARRIGASAAQVEAWIREWMFERPLKYLRFGRRADVQPLLDFLEARDIRAGVLSDYPVADKLQALGLEGRFTPLICATDPDVNRFKPDPAGYLKACRIWNLQPADVLYVGDRPEVDAAGARAAGMRCAILSAGSRRERTDDSASDGYLSVSAFGRLQRAIDGGF